LAWFLARRPGWDERNANPQRFPVRAGTVMMKINGGRHSRERALLSGKIFA
jgi:hypothetical protein